MGTKVTPPPTWIEIFNDSLERCRRSGDFLDEFYRRFMAASPEARTLFQHTDLHRQKRMLMASLYLLMMAAEGYEEGRLHLKRMADLHMRLGVSAGLYDQWLASLLETVSRCDPSFSREVAEAWRAVLMPGIEIMQTALGPSGSGVPAGRT